MERVPTHEWNTCCSKSSAAFVKYIVQVCFGAGLMIFAMIQIANHADNPTIYFSLLSGTVGTFFPHPSMAGSKALTQEDLHREFQKVQLTPMSPGRLGPTLERTLQDPEPRIQDS